MDRYWNRFGWIYYPKISEAILKSDFYFVCLSKNAVQSRWVLHELRFALTLEIEKDRPKVIPVMIEKCDLPIELIGRYYIDMTRSLNEAKDRIRQSVWSHLTEIYPLLYMNRSNIGI